jgi:hypothetical protein
VRIWRIRAALLAIYVISFFLPAFQICDGAISFPCGNTVPGWGGAFYSTFMIPAIPSAAIVGPRQILPVAVGGFVNPLVIAYLVLCVWPKWFTIRLKLMAAASLCLAMNGFAFIFDSVRPHAGYFLWAASVLGLFSLEVGELTARSRARKTALPLT